MLLMKRLLTALLLSVSLSGMAGELNIREVFKQMPDSLLPYISENNRLDFIDFLDSNMKAEVKNMLGGTSEMTSLTDSSLHIRLSEASQVDMFLVHPKQMVDSCTQLVCVIKTYGADSLSLDATVDFYTPQWVHTTVQPSLPDEENLLIERLKVQTILKWDDEMLNKTKKQ
jgi:hypothetical protein